MDPLGSLCEKRHSKAFFRNKRKGEKAKVLQTFFILLKKTKENTYIYIYRELVSEEKHSLHVLPLQHL